MAKCTSCGCYFKQHPFNRTNECDDCLDSLITSDSEILLEIELLKNKSCRTQPYISEDRDDTDSFSI